MWEGMGSSVWEGMGSSEREGMGSSIWEGMWSSVREGMGISGDCSSKCSKASETRKYTKCWEMNPVTQPK